MFKPVYTQLYTWGEFYKTAIQSKPNLVIWVAFRSNTPIPDFSHYFLIIIIYVFFLF